MSSDDESSTADEDSECSEADADFPPCGSLEDPQGKQEEERESSADDGNEDVDVFSDISDNSDIFHVSVDGTKTWTT